MFTTSNNNDFSNITISFTKKLQVFFNTLSLVFNITIQLNTTSNYTNTVTIINSCNNINTVKFINTHKSIANSDIFKL